VSGIANGQTQTATADTTVDDGVVMLEFTGLTSDSTYSVPITIGGVSYTTAKIRTAPDTNVKIAFGSCMHQRHPGVPMVHALRLGADSFIMLGDQGYFDDPDANVYGGLSCTDISTSISDLIGATGLSHRYCHYKHYLSDPGISRITHELNYYQTWDDHQIINEWEPAPERLDTELSLTPGTATSSDVTDCLLQSTNAFNAYAKGNPDSGDVLYYSFTRGDCEIFVPDCESYKTTYTAASTGYPASANDRTMLGATQLAWLKSGLAASTKTFKVIAFSKRFIGYTDTGNPDDWLQYPVENADIKSYIDNSVNGGNPDSWVKPGGVLILGGDNHNTQMDRAATLTMSSVCPMGSSLHNLGTTPSTVVYDAQIQGVFGLIEIYGSDRMQVSAIDNKGNKQCTFNQK